MKLAQCKYAFSSKLFYHNFASHRSSSACPSKVQQLATIEKMIIMESHSKKKFRNGFAQDDGIPLQSI
jgi:hypothetical protein